VLGYSSELHQAIRTIPEGTRTSHKNVPRKLGAVLYYDKMDLFS
jgi:hypothetical protein